MFGCMGWIFRKDLRFAKTASYISGIFILAPRLLILAGFDRGLQQYNVGCRTRGLKSRPMVVWGTCYHCNVYSVLWSVACVSFY